MSIKREISEIRVFQEIKNPKVSFIDKIKAYFTAQPVVNMHVKIKCIIYFSDNLEPHTREIEADLYGNDLLSLQFNPEVSCVE